MSVVLIMGASRGIGLETVRQALAAGHTVRAMSRSASAVPLQHPLLEKFSGDALVAEDVRRAIQGVEVVIQALGIRNSDLFRPVHLFSAATRVLLPEMQAQGVRRLITVTGFGAGARTVVRVRLRTVHMSCRRGTACTGVEGPEQRGSCVSGRARAGGEAGTRSLVWAE